MRGRPGSHWNPYPQRPTSGREIADALEQIARKAASDPAAFGVSQDQIDITANVAWYMRRGDRAKVKVLAMKHGDQIIGGPSEVLQWVDGLIPESRRIAMTMRDALRLCEETWTGRRYDASDALADVLADAIAIAENDFMDSVADEIQKRPGLHAARMSIVGGAPVGTVAIKVTGVEFPDGDVQEVEILVTPDSMAKGMAKARVQVRPSGGGRNAPFLTKENMPLAKITPGFLARTIDDLMRGNDE